MGKVRGKAFTKQRQRDRLLQTKRFEARKRELLDMIRKFADPVLKEVCPAATFDEPGLSMQIELMKRVLLATDNGIGLAAPQIGWLKRVYVARSSLDDRDVRVFINPSIVETNGVEKVAQEECLSYPKVVSRGVRFTRVKVKFFDENKQEHSEWMQDLDALAAQHEIDHLDGICRVRDAWEKSKLPPVPQISIADFFPIKANSNEPNTGDAFVATEAKAETTQQS